MSRGFYDAGYDVVLGVDLDEAAVKTFKANHGSAEAMKLDLFNHDNIDVIVNYLKDRNIKLDVFSNPNNSEKRKDMYYQKFTFSVGKAYRKKALITIKMPRKYR